MTTPQTPTVAPLVSARPVLLWRPDEEGSHVQPGAEQVAKFLNVSTEAVLAAIDAGELLEGWFVDWEVPASPARSS